MAPTRRKKPEKQPKRPSLAKRGRVAAPSTSEEATDATTKQRPATPVETDRAAGEAVVDLADGALYVGSPLTTEDASLQEDRLENAGPTAGRASGGRAVGGRASSSRAAAGGAAADQGEGQGAAGQGPDIRLPHNAVSAVMGTVVENLTTHSAIEGLRGGNEAASSGERLASAATGGDAGGRVSFAEDQSLAPEAGAKGKVVDGGFDASDADVANDAVVAGAADGADATTGSDMAGDAAVSATTASGGPTELSEEERAAFYAAVPKERANDDEKKGRPKRKGKVAKAKAKMAGNPRAGEAVAAIGQKAKDAAQAARGRKVSTGFVVKIALLVVLAAVVALAVASVVAFNQVRNGGNDAQDIQGTWYLNGTNVAVQVTPDEIVLTSDVAYDYQLNTTDKTIRLEFGNLEGGGRYLFSLDRSQLMIVDGEPNSAEAWLEDFGWTIQALLAQFRGDEYPLPTMEDATYLNRFPAPGGAVTDATAAASAEKSLLPAANEGSENGSNDGGDAGASGADSPDDAAADDDSQGSDNAGSDTAGTEGDSSQGAGGQQGAQEGDQQNAAGDTQGAGGNG